MRLSSAYIPTHVGISSQDESGGSSFLVKYGFIRQLASGIYSFLPLGLLVLRKIERIIREEMLHKYIPELLMPTVQMADLWIDSGRYNSYGEEMLKFKDRHKRDMLYGPTNEEVIVDIFKKDISSYKNLPVNLYQIQWKFRDELRPRSGLLRCREFLMFDGYSFASSVSDAMEIYHTYYRSFLSIFSKIGLSVIPAKADSGAIGGSINHEFHVPFLGGDSFVSYDSSLVEAAKNCDFEACLAANSKATDYSRDAVDVCGDSVEIAKCRSVEVGHIFYFGDKYSAAMSASVVGSDGAKFNPMMGSYGIGVSRLVAVIAEIFSDNRGLMWPISVAPYSIILINLDSQNNDCIAKSDEIYSHITQCGIDVLYDDVHGSVGEKLYRADGIGIPYYIVIGSKLLSNSECQIQKRCHLKNLSKNIAIDEAVRLAKSGSLDSIFI